MSPETPKPAKRKKYPKGPKPSGEITLVQHDERPEKNSSFWTRRNVRWQNFAKYFPQGPIVIMPCGEAAKAVDETGRKVITEGTLHQMAGYVSRNPRGASGPYYSDGYSRGWGDKAIDRWNNGKIADPEKPNKPNPKGRYPADKLRKTNTVIISEPLGIIPAEYEMHPLRPGYNLPIQGLTVHGELNFIRLVANWLAGLKLTQPEREEIFYFGPIHHLLILMQANRATTGRPLFKIIYRIVGRNISTPALEFRNEIEDYLRTGKEPEMKTYEELRDAFIRKPQGRYADKHRKFWYFIRCLQKGEEVAVAATTLKVSEWNEFKRGWDDMFDFETICTPVPEVIR